MTATAVSLAPASVLVEYLDPARLLTDVNIRLDPRLDKDFLASVKAHGVLVPVVAVRTADDRIRVRHGHRRTLAAIEAGVRIPVLIVGNETGGDVAEVDRIVGQYAENTHRAGLTTSERAGVVRQLLDLGLTAGQITRSTQIPRVDITAADTLTKSVVASQAAATYPDLTLFQAAALAEFEDDPDAVQALILAASEGEVRFDHAAQKLRDDRDQRATLAQARAGLEAAGVTIVEDARWFQELANLFDQQGEQLTQDSHRACPGHAVCLRQRWHHTDDDGDGRGGYQLVVEPAWICADPRAYGHHGRFPARQPGQSGGHQSDGGGAAGGAAERARAERRQVIENNKAWRSAETVRRAWLAGLLARKTPPPGALRFILTEIATAHWTLCSSLGQGHQLAAQLLGLDGKHAITDALTTAADGRAQVITLALILGAYEEHTSTETWRTPKDSDRHYLTTLGGWGYQPSDIENHVIGETAS